MGFAKIISTVSHIANGFKKLLQSFINNLLKKMYWRRQTNYCIKEL